METQRKTNEQFQIEVMEKLAEMTARRKESERSTRHGEDFEVAVFDFVNDAPKRLATSHPVPGTPPASSGTKERRHRGGAGTRTCRGRRARRD